MSVSNCVNSSCPDGANNAHHMCVGRLDRFPASLEASGLVKLTKAGSPYLDFNNGRAAQLPAV